MNTAKPICPGTASTARGSATDRPKFITYFIFSNAAKPKETETA